MKFKIPVLMCLLILVSVSPAAIFAQKLYKVHFNNIVCLNPWNNSITPGWLSLAHPINAEFLNAAGKSSGPAPLKFTTDQTADYDLGNAFAHDGKTETKYFNNMSFDKFPNKLLDPARFINQPERGKPVSFRNDRFYMTDRNTPRRGVVLPLIGGDKDMYRFAYWNPTTEEGNPSLVSQGTVIYYLWEANIISTDRQIGNFSINLKAKKDKGPQLVEVAHGFYSGGKWLSSVYIIEYEVK